MWSLLLDGFLWGVAFIAGARVACFVLDTWDGLRRWRRDARWEREVRQRGTLRLGEVTGAKGEG